MFNLKNRIEIDEDINFFVLQILYKKNTKIQYTNRKVYSSFFKSAKKFKIGELFTKLQAVKYLYLAKPGFITVSLDIGDVPKFKACSFATRSKLHHKITILFQVY